MFAYVHEHIHDTKISTHMYLLCHAHFVQLVMDLLPTTCVLRGHCHLHQGAYNVVGKLSNIKLAHEGPHAMLPEEPSYNIVRLIPQYAVVC